MEPILNPPDEAERRARFEHEVLMQLDALYGFARRLTGDPHDAEDVVSETVLHALDHWESYRLGSNARAWLFTILHNAFVSRLHRARREVQMPRDEDGPLTFDVVGEVDPEGAFYDSFIDEGITRAIDGLPDVFRVAVVLSDIHRLRNGEIAAVLAVPTGTVKSRLSRGRRMLQKKLVRYAVERGYLHRERRGAA